MVENIHRDLLELSNIELQRSYWNNMDRRHVSSYAELMSRLFDDDGFDEFVSALEKGAGSNTPETKKIVELREMLDSYNDDGKSDNDILGDSRWHDIVKQAQTVVEHWPKYTSAP